jgi:hypothetical protein
MPLVTWRIFKTLVAAQPTSNFMKKKKPQMPTINNIINNPHTIEKTHDNPKSQRQYNPKPNHQGLALVTIHIPESKIGLNNPNPDETRLDANLRADATKPKPCYRDPNNQKDSLSTISNQNCLQSRYQNAKA